MNSPGGTRLSSLLRKNRTVFFDGAMGTMIQASGAVGYACPEELNLTSPALIRGIHASYVKAGARIIETNTFGANPLKLSKTGLEAKLGEIIGAAVGIAREAAGSRALVAGSLGPLGEFLEPIGTVTPREALDHFTASIGHFARAGADLVVIETMSDLKEVRAACLAAAAVGMPFAMTMTFDEDGRTILGTPPESAVITAEALGASLVGVNCGSGPSHLLPAVRRMAAVARRPLLVQPNAGIPVLEGGRTVFPSAPGEFASQMEEFLQVGARALGGCCGTTPEHIAAMVARLEGQRPVVTHPATACRLAGRGTHVLIGPSFPVAVIGERINPTGRRELAARMREGRLESVRAEIVDQVRSGSHALDLNAGAADLDETAVLPLIVSLAQKAVSVPLSIDSTRPETLEAALRHIEGRPLINSVNAGRKSLETILPLAKRHGAALIGLAMDEKGIPADAATRLKLAERILRAAEGFGLGAEDILIDTLAVAAGSEQSQVMETLRAIQSLRGDLGTGSILGVSNVSYGLPAREELNAAFISMAVFAGLDAAIVNPHSSRVTEALASAMVLSGRDAGAASFIRRHAAPQVSDAPPRARSAGSPDDLSKAVLEGDADRTLRLVREALDSGLDPMKLGHGVLIPALEKVGDLFERKIHFLPQVIASAEAARGAFNLLNERMPKSKGRKKARVLLATVEGDVHDLGKNILKALLENYGYAVEDLGINVPPRRIVERAKRGGASIVGLSALMTTTLPSMESSLRALKRELPRIPVIVGGAVLTAEYAASIGADGYAPDASRGVKLVRKLLGGK